MNVVAVVGPFHSAGKNGLMGLNKQDKVPESNLTDKYVEDKSALRTSLGEYVGDMSALRAFLGEYVKDMSALRTYPWVNTWRTRWR